MAIKKGTPAKEEPTATEVVEKVAIESNLFIKLAKASTYVHSDGVTFTKENTYEVTKNRGAALLAEIAPSGVPLFVEVSDPDNAKKNKKIAVKSLDPKVAEEPELSLDKLLEDGVDDSKIVITHKDKDPDTIDESDPDGDEFDTGAMSLEADDGSEVGTVI